MKIGPKHKELVRQAMLRTSEYCYETGRLIRDAMVLCASRFDWKSM